jgi:IPT/TIG domain
VSPLARYGPIAAGALVVLALVGFAAMRFLGGSVKLDSAEPGRGRSGTTVTLTGTGFATDPKGNSVLFDDTPATILSASATRLEVAVPEIAVTGEEAKVAIHVRAGRGPSNPVEFVVLGGPTIHGISPDVAMPGEEVVLAGSGFGLGAALRFGSAPAEVIEVKDTSIRARVPAVAGGPGTAAPAVVSMGAASSNELPFFIGSIPLVLKIEPGTAAPGDAVSITGRGFQRDRTRNAVLVAGVFALVVSSSDSELKVAVPTLAPGEAVRPVEVRVAGLANVGRGSLTTPPLPESVELHLVPQPFDAAAGRSYAVLATDVGPAFVLAGTAARSAAERAMEAQRRFDEAVTAIKATRGLNFEARALETSPVIGLPGRPEVILEVTDEDARAYDADWTGLKGRGGPVTRARLARWWEAVAKDLVLLLVRGERPQFTAALAPEGRALLDIYQAAQKTGRFGVAREAVTGLRPPQRDALRLVGFRVPASVTGPAMAAAVVPAGAAPAVSAGVAPAAASAAGLKLEGAWIGSEDESGERRYLTANFRSGSGTVAYEGIVTLTVPLLSLESPQRGMAKWSLQFKGGIRYYTGKWDGQSLRGNISRDAGGTSPVGTFELRPR